RLDLMGETHRLVHLMDALAGNVVLPAMVGATQAVLFIAAEPERHTTVRTELLQQTHAAAGVAERDEALAEQPHANGWAVGGGQLPREERWQPITAQRLTH